MHRSAGHPGRRPVLTEGIPQDPGPLPCGHPDPGAGHRRGHQVRIGLGRVPQAPQRLVHGARVAPGPPGGEIDTDGGLHRRVDGLDRRAQVGEQRVRLGGGEGVHADHHVLAGLDAHPTVRLRADELGLHVAAFDRGHRTAHRLHPVDLALGRFDQFGHPPFDDDRAFEDVGVLQQVGLVGENLLDAQGPLLVPRSGQAEGLVPRRQLQSPAAGILRQRHPEGFQHDPDDVVLRLRLGQAERVDLDAVAEPPVPGIGDPVPGPQQRVPQRHERPHLAHFLDEANARVDEERHPRADLADALGRHLPRGDHRIEHGDGRAHRVGDLLDGCGTGLLQVVAANVDRVPRRDLGHGVGDHVRDQPKRGHRREHVRSAGEVLLDDVVLSRAGQRRRVRALFLGDNLIQREQPHGRRIDRHRRVHLAQRNVVEQRAHVADMRDRHAYLADLTTGELVVGVIAGLGRQVERDREPGLPLGQIPPVQCIGFHRVGMTRIGPDDPRPVPLWTSLLRLVPPRRVGHRHTLPRGRLMARSLPTGNVTRSSKDPDAPATR